MAKAQLYIVTVIDGDGGDGEYWVNAVDVRYARRFAVRSHSQEAGGAYVEVHNVQGPYEYDPDQPTASAKQFTRRSDKRNTKPWMLGYCEAC